MVLFSLSVLLIITGVLFAPFCVDLEKISVKYSSPSRIDIWHIPELFQKKYYLANKLSAYYLINVGLTGLILSFIAIWVAGW